MIALQSLALAFMMAASPPPSDSVAIFIEACLEGEFRVPPEAAEISTETSSAATTKRVRLRSPQADLTIANHLRPKDTGIEAVCTVVSPEINFADAVRRVNSYIVPVGDLPFGPGLRRYEQFIPAARYRVRIWRDGRSVAMQTTLLEPERAELELDKLRAQSKRMGAKPKKAPASPTTQNQDNQ